jgi:hypothetical protein
MTAWIGDSMAPFFGTLSLSILSILSIFWLTVARKSQHF